MHRVPESATQVRATSGYSRAVQGELIGEHRPDLIVENAIVVEIKRVERIERVHIAQMVTYLRMTGLKAGLILNFNCAVLRAGIRRVLL
jgi:GxxExxY protein